MDCNTTHIPFIIIQSEMIGCILESYNVTGKITNYNITFTEFDYK
jgi:hypothetical protein